MEEFDSSLSITEEGHQSTFDDVFLFPASQQSQLGITCVNHSIFLPNTCDLAFTFAEKSGSRFDFALQFGSSYNHHLSLLLGSFRMCLAVHFVIFFPETS